MTSLWHHFLSHGFKFAYFEKFTKGYQPAKFQCCRLSGSSFTKGLQKQWWCHYDIISYFWDSKFPHFVKLIISYQPAHKFRLIWNNMSQPLKCRHTRLDKYIEKIPPYFAKFCFLVYELLFFYISGNFLSAASVRGGKISRNVEKRKLIYKKAEFWKIRYILNIFFILCRSTFHMTSFHIRWNLWPAKFQIPQLSESNSTQSV